MYNIVIADDEEMERMVLRQALENYPGGRCVVRTAVNGREAVKTALDTGADVAFMDIEMPGMNGLEASRIISQKLPCCKIIMLTAYGEFEYAREAISLGSADYLLKPCTDESLYRALDRVVTQINRRREEDVEKAHAVERIHTLSLQVEEQIVRTVMGGHIAPEYILAQIKACGAEFHNGVFAIIHAACAGNGKNIAATIKNGAAKAGLHPFLYLYDGKIYAVNVSADENTDSAEATAAWLKQASGTLCKGPLFASVGGSFSDLLNAQTSCLQAQMALARCTREQPVSIYSNEYEHETERPDFADDPDETEETGKARHLQKVRDGIEKYVALHYHEELLLPGIARAMNYSSAYFSKLFKQCFHRNFITYLTDVRIEAARKLIAKTNLTIREVSEKVGYNDPNYFTKVFRRAVGVNPSEYREPGA